jgi:hypothetical protein
MGGVASRPECGRDLAEGDVGKSPTASIQEYLIHKRRNANPDYFEKTLLKSYNVRQDEMKMKIAEKWKP